MSFYFDCSRYYEGPKYVDDMAAWLKEGWKTKPKGKEIKSAPTVNDADHDLKTIVGTNFNVGTYNTNTNTPVYTRRILKIPAFAISCLVLFPS